MVGISADKPAIQLKFVEKFGLTFPMVPDPDKTIIASYGALKVTGLTAQRSTFLVDPDGRIARVWPAVKVDGHADEVVAAIKELSGR